MWEKIGISGINKEAIITLILFATVILIAHIIKFIWRHFFIRIAKKTRTNLDLMILQATENPVYITLLSIGFYLSIQKLVATEEIKESFWIKGLSGFFYTFLVLSITYLLYALIKGFCDWYLKDIAEKTKTKFDEQFIPLFSRLLKIVLFFIAATIILSKFKVNISGFIATAGIASLAFALAAQETLSNFISGFMLLVDRPFRVGDRIELPGGELGDVYEIGMRTTKILSFNNTMLVIPNSEIAKTKIINHSYPDPKVKIRQTISVAYGSDLEKVKDIVLKVCKSHPKVLNEPEPQIFFTEFGESSLDLKMICWVEDLKEKFRTNDELNMEIKKRFEEEKIEIPFPQTDIHIRK